VLRTAKNGKHALLVVHTFGKPLPKSVEIPLTAIKLGREQK
jgi:hypothetical protein